MVSKANLLTEMINTLYQSRPLPLVCQFACQLPKNALAVPQIKFHKCHVIITRPFFRRHQLSTSDLILVNSMSFRSDFWRSHFGSKSQPYVRRQYRQSSRLSKQACFDMKLLRYRERRCQGSITGNTLIHRLS